MILQIVPKFGGQPVQIEASQLLVLGNRTGTALMVAGEFGPDGVKVAHAGDPDFNQTLRAFGYGDHKIKLDILETPPPPKGGRLIAGPGVR
jgi:hypothetical protein